ncbi:hypothetical protein G6F63_015791 [Rhizopus arrhizus]|nr:hypothetical protein G6F63_015791 [Rhizopus arrhizus]
MAEKLLTSMRAYLEASGTVCIRSSPEMAGTTPFVTGSTFIAIVPPVAMNWTTGRLSAAAPTDIAHIAKSERTRSCRLMRRFPNGERNAYSSQEGARGRATPGPFRFIRCRICPGQ